MAWMKWDSLEDFNSWHSDACSAAHIPYPGVNQGTGLINDHATWTTAITDPVIVAENDVRANIPDNIDAPLNATECDPPVYLEPQE